MYEYGTRLRGGPISGETIRHGHQLGGKRAAPPETRPRTDVDDSDCRQNSAPNEHEIMKEPGHEAGSSTNGLSVRCGFIQRCIGTNVGEATSTHTGDNVALCLRGSGRGSKSAKARIIGRSGIGRSRGRGRPGGEQASLSEGQPAPQTGVAYNTATAGNRPPLEDHAQVAYGQIPSLHNPASYPPPLIRPGSNPYLDAGPYRVPNPNFSSEPAAQPYRVPNPNFSSEPYQVPDPNFNSEPPAQPYRVPNPNFSSDPPAQPYRVPNPNFNSDPPARPDPNLLPAPPAGANQPSFSVNLNLNGPPFLPAWSPPSALPMAGRPEPYVSAARTYPNSSDRSFPERSLLIDSLVMPGPAGHGFLNRHFPWNFLQHTALPEYDLMLWRALQDHAPNGVPPDWLVGLNRGLAHGGNPLRLSEVSISAIRRWIERIQASQHGGRQH